jgi:hypothetical protein
MKTKKELFIDHINFDHLHAFLDGELAASENQIIERHLSSCRRCCGHLEDLNALSDALNNLEEIPMESNLAPRVINEINSNSILNQSMIISLSFQLVTAIILLILVIPIVFDISKKVDVIHLLTQLVELMRDTFNQQLFQLANFFSRVPAFFSDSKHFFTSFQIFNSNENFVWSIFITSAILFIVGNYLLLKKLDPLSNI